MRDVLNPRELNDALGDPEWCEAPVTSGTSPFTLVESVDRETAVPASLPRVLVTVGARSPGADVVVDSGDLDGVENACRHRPQASIVLVQLLRVTEHRPVRDALLAESLAYSVLLGGSEFRSWLAEQPRREHRSDEHTLLLDDDDEMISVTLHRPEVRNAYDASIRDSLIDVLRAVMRVRGSRHVVLRGAGSAFCSGGDLSEFGTNDDLARAHLIRAGRAPGLLLNELGSDVSADIHGACVGAGIELAAFCGHVRAREDATFRLPEIDMGLVPGAGGTVSIPRRIGRQRTAALALSGRAIDARTASAWGLVDEVVV